MLDNKHLLKLCTFGTSLHPPAQYVRTGYWDTAWRQVEKQIGRAWQPLLCDWAADFPPLGLWEGRGSAEENGSVSATEVGRGPTGQSSPGNADALSESGAVPATSRFLSWSPGSGFSSQISGPNLRAPALSPVSACDSAAPRTVMQQGQPQRPGAAPAAPLPTAALHRVSDCLYPSHRRRCMGSVLFLLLR